MYHISLASFYGTSANSADPDETLHNACTFEVLMKLKLSTKLILLTSS